MLRNNFRVTKNFLITKFDCTWMVPYVFKRSHNCDFWLSLTHDSNLSWVSRFYRKNRIFRPRESSPSKDKNRKSPKNKRRTVNIAKTKNKFLIPPAQAQWTTVENLKRIISKFRILSSAVFFSGKKLNRRDFWRELYVDYGQKSLWILQWILFTLFSDQNHGSNNFFY